MRDKTLKVYLIRCTVIFGLTLFLDEQADNLITAQGCCQV